MSLPAFDQHQTTSYGTAAPVTCHDPAARGLIRGNDGRWHVPLSAAGAARLTNLRASQAPGVVQ